MGAQLTTAWLRLYCAALGVPEYNHASDDFGQAREQLHQHLGIQYRDPLVSNGEECALLISGTSVEGTIHPADGMYIVTPLWDHNLPLGAVGTLRLIQGDFQVVVLDGGDTISAAILPPWSERRRHRRINTEGFAVVRLGDHSIEARLNDLSVGGTSLSTPILIETGTQIDMLLRVQGKKDFALECKGIVTRCSPAKTRRGFQLGISFDQVSESIQKQIDEMERGEE